jgi:hypothetical protein
MTKKVHTIIAPRIEIVLVPDEREANVNKQSTLFDLFLMLHVPDGKDPLPVRVGGGPFDRDKAALKLSRIWMEIGEHYAERPH